MHEKAHTLVDATKESIKKKDLEIASLKKRIEARGEIPPPFFSNGETVNKEPENKTEKLIYWSKTTIADRNAYIKQLADFLAAAKIQKVEVINKLPDQKIEIEAKMPPIVKVHVENQKDLQQVEVKNHPAVQLVEIKNHKEIQKVLIENPTALQAVEIKNFKDVQDVKVTNLEFPDIQKVEVQNDEKASGWMPGLVVEATKAISGLFTKLWGMGLTVRLAEEERLKPLAVIVVDMLGRPVNQNQQVSSFIAMGNSGGRKDPSPASSIGSGQKNVATAGTRVQLAAAACTSLTIKAKIANTGKIYVGSANVSASTGFELAAGDTLSLDINNTSLVFLDSTVNAEGITYTYIN